MKREPVESLEPEEQKTKVKTELENETNFETLSLELTFVNTEDNNGDQSDKDMLDLMNTNLLNQHEKRTSESENLGDAWFKKISELENKASP